MDWRHILIAGAAVLTLVLADGPTKGAAAQAQANAATEQGTVTGLPLPRYVSVRADEVNVRTGPGVRYPIDWVFVRENMPVEVVAEFETWRQIRDWQGVTGWVHRSMLSGKRTVMVTPDMITVRRDADANSPPVARAEQGVVGGLDTCRDGWCRVTVGGVVGWAPRNALWGATPGEEPLAELPLPPAAASVADTPSSGLPTPADNN